MIPLWLGSCNQWDCDEMGHMNVRVYVEKQMEGLVSFAHALDMPHAFAAKSMSTLVPTEQHIRFLAEVLPGRPLHMQGCVLEIGDTDALIYQELRHSDGRLAAAFRTRVVHRDTVEGQAFKWNTAARAQLEAHLGEAPAESAPRSFDLAKPGLAREDINQDRIKAIKAPRIGLGAVSPQQLNAFGRLWAPHIIGRISDSVPTLMYDWRNRVASNGGSARVGAAVLEYRLRYHAFPKAGDLFAAYSSLGATAEKTYSLVHWVMDPATGRPWATCEAVAITMDLDARKAIKATADMLEELERIAPRGLAL